MGREALLRVVIVWSLVVADRKSEIRRIYHSGRYSPGGVRQSWGV